MHTEPEFEISYGVHLCNALWDPHSPQLLHCYPGMSFHCRARFQLLAIALQISACGELARLGLIAGSPEPGAATALYDWDLATAALAASHAVKRQLDATLAQRRDSQQPPAQQPGRLLCTKSHQHAYLQLPLIPASYCSSHSADRDRIIKSNTSDSDTGRAHC